MYTISKGRKWVDTAEECHRLRRENKRLRGWLRWWNDGARDECLFYMLSINELRDARAGKPAPRVTR
jgi:hypothetical protein